MPVARSLTRPTATFTAFFREPNLALLADLAPKLFDPNELLTVAQIGPSSGEETWTLASAFAVKGLDFFIRAYEANPSKLSDARRAVYEVTPSLLFLSCRSAGFSMACLDHFVFGRRNNRVEPSEDLRADVAFVERNILHKPLPEAAAKVVLANNVLYHFDADERDIAFQTMVDGAEDGALVMFNPDNRIRNWTARLPDRFPVTPCLDAPEYYAPATLIVNRG